MTCLLYLARILGLWELWALFPFLLCGWFFPQSWILPPNKGTEQQSTEDSTGTFCRSLKAFVQLSSLQPTILWLSVALSSLNSSLSLLNSWRPHDLPTLSLLVHLPRNSLQEVTWGNYTTHLIYFPSVSCHYPVLPDIPCWKTIVSHILSNFFIALGEMINWVSIYSILDRNKLRCLITDLFNSWTFLA